MGTYEKPFTLLALDKDFQIITKIPYSSLQWNRKYHQAGTFSVVLNNRVQYTKDWKYIYTASRPELGEISQVNWKKDGTKTDVTISGYFMENILNRHIVYPKPSEFANNNNPPLGASIIDNPSTPKWVSYEGTADVVAKAFFDGFKKVYFRCYCLDDFEGSALVARMSELGFEITEVESGEYKYSCHTRNGEKLGAKLYDILNESGASYRVGLDFENSQIYCKIIHGKNRTATTTEEGINPCVLSSRNGTITNASLVVSDTELKNAVMMISESEDKVFVMASEKRNATGVTRFEKTDINQNVNDYLENGQITENTKKRFRLDANANGNDVNREKCEKFNFQFSAITGSYNYMENFDIGDMISIEIPEIDLSMDAQIIGLNEVVENGIWSMKFEVGNEILRKRGNY